jgi:1-acyl-sn-glycerol-3-phosphate acyltransferase
MLYSLVTFLLRAILRIIARVTVYGRENLPSSTTYVAVSNHIGRLDPAFIYYLLNRKDIIILVAEKYKDHIWSHLLAKAVNGIFVDRYNADVNAMRELLRRIKQGGVAVLAPEGTRSPTASLMQGWNGASYIASKSGLPIIPVGIIGSGDRERLQIVISAGLTFSLPPLIAKTRDEQLKAYTEEIMCRIAAELPEAYRGIYSEHVRLNELLADKAMRKLQPPLVLG